MLCIRIGVERERVHISPMDGIETATGSCRCAAPGCALPGSYRAPKDRSLKDYVYFCLDHIRVYNANWNFHAGLSPEVIELELRSAATWDRPTWKLGALGQGRGNWRNAAVHDPFDFARGTRFDTNAKGDGWTMRQGMDTEHRRAMKTLDLSAPFSLTDLKTRYKELVKRHHPDANRGVTSADDRMKAINAAYALLKKAMSRTSSAA